MRNAFNVVWQILIEKSFCLPDGMTHWEKPVVQSPQVHYGNEWICPVYQAPSVNIELTAYALLTYIKVYGVMNSWPIAKWLVAQRNGNGGFASTQVNLPHLCFS